MALGEHSGGGSTNDKGSYLSAAGMRLHLRADRNRGCRKIRSPVPRFPS